MALACGVGAYVNIEAFPGTRAGMLFGEDQATFVVTSPRDATSLMERLNAFGVTVEHIGITGGDAISFSFMGDQPSEIRLVDLRAAHEGFFPALMGADGALA